MSICDTIKNAQGMVDKILDLAECVKSIDVSGFVNTDPGDYLDWFRKLSGVVQHPNNLQNLRDYAATKVKMQGIGPDDPGYAMALLDATDEAVSLRLNRNHEDAREPEKAWQMPKDPYSGNTGL